MPHHYDVTPFDEQDTENAAGKKKKKNINTPDNFGLKDMTSDFKKKYRQMLEQHNNGG